jgi:hypothetical protein
LDNIVVLPDVSVQSEGDDYGYELNVSSTLNASTHLESKSKIEILNYLSDPSKDLSVLHHYPSISSVFYMYNTSLPSSAPVERLFSCAGNILLPNRNRLSDAMFERLLMLKSNSNLCK